ncbi:MAG: hypothetical protein EON56_00480 [Alphaproteobacteria bacterium]|nr:MAG: hypothetical protein EON56_00480 [Alphaproteobacteria bacterium]
MKSVSAIATIALSGIVFQAAVAATTLTINEVTAAGRQAEKSPKALKSLAGKPISLEIGPRDNDPHFRSALGDPGITVICQASSEIASGNISAVIESFELDVDSGREQINVLKLKNCKNAG